MSYLVKELFLTLQGEGFHAGTPAVFCRFAGCNLWTGREEHRASAICQFCDTDFVGTDGPGGGRFASADGPIKTFTLRGIKDSPPYLHDGRCLTLEDTVEFFNLVLGTKLTTQEKQDLVLFLRTL